MKIIIAGAGEVGTYLAKMLHNGNHDITVIDTDSEKLKFIDSHFDLMTINGSATSLEVLVDANIKRADLFIAITEIEEVNIIAAIFAKRLGVKKTIVRIDNKEYLLAKNKEYFTGLGIDSMVYPEILTSREIVTLLRQSAVYRTFQFSGGSLSLYIIRLEKNTPIINKTLIKNAIIFMI